MSQLTFDGFVQDKKNSWYKGRTLSHSSVSAYRTCPQKWKFRYIDKVPEKPRSFFSFGKSVHQGLEFLFGKIGAPLPTLDEMLEHYKTAWLREGYETPAQEKWFYQEGERILRGYYAKHGSDFRRVFKVEHKFTVDVDGVPVMGYIDRIDETPGGNLAIVDYKTGKAFDKSRVRSDPQLTLYQIACRETLGKEVETVTLYHLNSLTAITTPAHSSALETEVKANIVEAARGISESLFEPKPDPKGYCGWCDYLQICPAFAGKKIAPAQQAQQEDSMRSVADRYGKLSAMVQELFAEKEELEENLRSHFERTGTELVEGDHFTIRLTRKDEKDEPNLEVKRKT